MVSSENKKNIDNIQLINLEVNGNWIWLQEMHQVKSMRNQSLEQGW